MTPKEKAEELVSNYLKLDLGVDGFMLFLTSKQCALIAVDEMIKNGCSVFYWQQVKNEIEKL